MNYHIGLVIATVTFVLWFVYEAIVEEGILLKFFGMIGNIIDTTFDWFYQKPKSLQVIIGFVFLTAYLAFHVITSWGENDWNSWQR